MLVNGDRRAGTRVVRLRSKLRSLSLLQRSPSSRQHADWGMWSGHVVGAQRGSAGDRRVSSVFLGTCARMGART